MMFHNMDMNMVLLLVLNNNIFYATCSVDLGRNFLLQPQRYSNIPLIT